jgi:hypothetical protein
VLEVLPAVDAVRTCAAAGNTIVVGAGVVGEGQRSVVACAARCLGYVAPMGSSVVHCGAFMV